MNLAELRAIAQVSQEGWVVTWKGKGYVISKGISGEMELEAERAGKRKLREIKSLDAVARIMAEDIGVATYTVRGRAPDQQDLI